MGKGARTRFYVDIMSLHPKVTGSHNLAIVKFPNGETTKFLVDSGLFQEKEYGSYNSKLICDVSTLDFVLATHNHVDHTGRLPYLVKNGYHKFIYMTKETSKLVGPALGDSASVLRDFAKRNNTQPLYSQGDVENTLHKAKPVEFGKPVYVTPNIKATFFKNGHLVGAAMILVQISYPEYEDINLLFTGDYNNKNMFFEVEDLPDWVKKLPINIVQEATYGDTRTTDVPPKCFVDNVSNAIAEGKTVISLVFSLGRSQEILYTLKMMQKGGKLSRDIPIYFDGKLAFKYTSLYLNSEFDLKENMKEFLPDNLHMVDSQERSIILSDNTAKIIVTTSGMGSYGPAQVYLPVYLQKRNTLIHFTGYTSEGTLGARLKNTPNGETVQVGGLLIVKRADVQYTTEFSSHAKADEMIAFLKQFTDLKLVLVNHGETETKKTFAESVLKEVDTNYVGILGEGYLFRMDHYGFVKSMSTKFE